MDLPESNYAIKRLTDREFAKLQNYIQTEIGIKMPASKRVMLESRLQKRVKFLGMQNFSEYCEHLFSTEGEKNEISEMIDAVTTNKTDFMREPAHFDFMLSTALPELAKRKSRLHLWSAASSTGQEPYTMAMIVEEYIRTHRNIDYSILGTDICKSALETGKTAIYPLKEADPVPPDYRKRYMLKGKGTNADNIRMKPFIRGKVRYLHMNLMSERYPIRDTFDIIFCRNVLIYFNRENQTAILKRIYELLNPGGFLFIGHSESLAGSTLRMNVAAPTIYRK